MSNKHNLLLTIITLSIGTDRSEQTVSTHSAASDQGPHCLPLCPACFYTDQQEVKWTCSNFRTGMITSESKGKYGIQQLYFHYKPVFSE